jgi:carbamoyl-phosphate synthase large subunit
MGHSVLVTAAGGDIGQSIVRILRRFKQIVSIIGTDISDDNAGPYFVDRFILVPNATDKEYINTLKKIVKENGISYLIPVSEMEIQVLNDYLSSNKNFVVPIIMANKKSISLCFDKYETIRFLEAQGIRMPWTVPIGQEPYKYPCILKNRRGYGSKNLVILEDRTDWQYYRDKRSDTILQELLLPNDSEFTCGVYRGFDKIARCLVLKRVLQGGLTIKAEVVEDKPIEELCFKVAELLELRGSINVQLRKTESGPRIFEINPRFSSTVLFRHHVNFCDLIWSMEDMLGIKFLECNLPVTYGTKIYRYYQEVFKYEDKFFKY